LTESRAGRLSLIGGVLALDFANTASGRDGAQAVEHLQRPEHVVDWALHARSIDAATAQRCRAAVERSAAAAKQVLRDALVLRDAVYRIGTAIAREEAPSRLDLGILKMFAADSISSTELAPERENGYRFDFSAGPVESALFGPVAWSAVELLATGDFGRVKRCPGHGCGWLFFDKSKNNSRRWCDMAVCGNRSKVQRHREHSS
jgi:predicted RNA-binding Zn ribbon-like protein